MFNHLIQLNNPLITKFQEVGHVGRYFLDKKSLMAPWQQIDPSNNKYLVISLLFHYTGLLDKLGVKKYQFNEMLMFIFMTVIVNKSLKTEGNMN